MRKEEVGAYEKRKNVRTVGRVEGGKSGKGEMRMKIRVENRRIKERIPTLQQKYAILKDHWMMVHGGVQG